MQGLKEPRVTPQNPAGREDRRSPSAWRPVPHEKTVAQSQVQFAPAPVADRSMSRGSASQRRQGAHTRPTPKRQPDASRAGASRNQAAAKPLPSVVPVRARKAVVDRLAQQEARMLAGVVACASVVCGLLVIYLAAYAQVANLGIQMSKARVDLRTQRMKSETLQAQVAQASSPALIARAAVKNGMVLEHTEQICYINPSADPGDMTMRTAQAPVPPTTTAPPVSQAANVGLDPQSGARVASRGANADDLTTASVAN